MWFVPLRSSRPQQTVVELLGGLGGSRAGQNFILNTADRQRVHRLLHLVSIISFMQ